MVSRRFARFLLVGCIGFAVDAGVLVTALRHLTSSVYAARAVSFTAAVFVTWLCNRTFVFAASGSGAAAIAEYGRYLATQVTGALANLLIFVLLIELVPRLAATPVVPLAVGAIAGALVNYAGSAWWVFRSRGNS
jgi:putative flippase GtrA